MKYIKQYNESIKNEPHIGDYILLKNNVSDVEHIQKFVSNNIGQYIRKNKYTKGYVIQYEGRWNRKRPKSVVEPANFIFQVSKKEILYFSSNKKDVEIYLEAKKYNL